MRPFKQWLNEACAKEKNPGNILAPGGMTPAIFEDLLVQEILGSGWYIPYSCNGDQARVEILAAILKKFDDLQPWYVRLARTFKQYYREFKELVYEDHTL